MNNNDLIIASRLLKKVNDTLKQNNRKRISSVDISDYMAVRELVPEDRYMEEIVTDTTLATLTRYAKDIDIKRFILYCFYKIDRLPEHIKAHDYAVSNLFAELKSMAKTYIPENQDIVIYEATVSDTSGFFEVNVISSKEYIYGKEPTAKAFKVEEYFNELINCVELNDVELLFKDKNLADGADGYLKFNTLKNMGYSFNKIVDLGLSQENEQVQGREFYDEFQKEKIKLFNRPEIKSRMSEDDLYALAAYRYIDRLDTTLEMYNKDGIEDAMPRVSVVYSIYTILKQVEENIDPKRVNINVSKDGNVNSAKPFNMDVFREDMRNIFDTFGKHYIEEEPLQAYNPQLLSMISKEQAISLLDNAEHKDEYYFMLYQVGYVPFKEMLDFETSLDAEHKEELENDYRLKALLTKLTRRTVITEKLLDMYYKRLDENREKAQGSNNIQDKEEASGEFIEDIQGDIRDSRESILEDIEKLENFFSITLEDDSLYEILDDDFKTKFAMKSFEQVKTNGEYASQARKNLKVLAKKGDFDQELIRVLFIYENATLADLEEIIGKDMLMDSYDPEELGYSYSTLYNLEKKPEEELSKEEKEQKFILEGQFKFQRELFKAHGYLGNEDAELEYLMELGDLIYDKDVLRELYLYGLISGHNLYGTNKDLAIELYNVGILRQEDKKYMILDTDVKVTAGDLIRLGNEGIISNKQALSLYMDGRCTLQSFKDYVEGIDAGDVFDENDLIDRTKQFAVVRRDDIARDYQRYIRAYSEIGGVPSKEVMDKIYKALGGKNARGEDICDLYSKGIINIETIDASNNRLLIYMIRKGVLTARDEEYLFRDTEADGRKYLKLAEILPSLNEDQKINLLASVYSTIDDISRKRVNFLARYLEDATEERNRDAKQESSSRATSEGRIPKVATVTPKTNNLFAFGEKFKAFRAIEPNYEHEVASGSYIINFRKLDTVVLEEIYRTTADGINSFNTQHATYIIKNTQEVCSYLGLDPDGDLYAELLDKLIKINSRNKEYIDWSKVTRMYREDKIPGVAICLHTTEERWQNILRKKIGITDGSAQAKIEECLSEIKNSKDKEDMEH